MTGPETRVAYRLAKRDLTRTAWPARRLAASRVYWARPTLWRAPGHPRGGGAVGRRSIWQVLAEMPARLMRRQGQQARA